MPGVNFKAEFAKAVAAGEKTQTIRRVRKYPICVGDTLYLKTGQRTTKCDALGEGICTSVTPIRITDMGAIVDQKVPVLLGSRLNDIAKADGFQDWARLRAWFERQYGLPFDGVIITWRLVHDHDAIG